MDKNIKICEIDSEYVDYLSKYAKHQFHNKQDSQKNERKYIGVVFAINGLKYFAPLSSFKEKHKRMKEGADFIKIKNYAVINLNNMLPAPDSVVTYIDISKEADEKYRSLLFAEYRIIKTIQSKIKKKASFIYSHKITRGESTNLAKRCDDFLELEKACNEYIKSKE